MFQRRCTKILLILAIVLLIVVFLYGKKLASFVFTSKTISRTMDESPFKKGEIINYDVKLYNFRIGKAQLSYEGLEAKKDVQAILITFLTDVANFHDLDKIYAVPKSFYPLRVERSILFFGKEEVIEEDYKSNPKAVTITKNKKGNESSKVITSDRPLQHAISSIYYYRQFKNIKIGRKFYLNLPLDKLELEVKRIEEISVPAGKFQAFYIESVPKKFRLWLSVDEKRIPLKIVGAVSLAPAELVMTNYQEGTHVQDR
ncbi:MAG: DUF3108 domain-containing protein [Candidatus Omnitrophica bacterium]|nr:DUF3108 domain-containing protein [Candidatus Omnitrophota bacterium]